MTGNNQLLFVTCLCYHRSIDQLIYYHNWHLPFSKICCNSIVALLYSCRGAVSFTHNNRQPLTDSERAWRLRQTEAVEVEPRRSGASELHWRDRSSGGVYHKWQVTKRKETGRPDAGTCTSCNSNEMVSVCLIGFFWYHTVIWSWNRESVFQLFWVPSSQSEYKLALGTIWTVNFPRSFQARSLKNCLFKNQENLPNLLFWLNLFQALALNKDGNFFVSGGFSRYLRIWRTHDLSLLHTYAPCDGSIRALTVSTDQRYDKHSDVTLS